MKKKTNAELETENKMLRDEVDSLRKMVFASLNANGFRWQVNQEPVYIPYTYPQPVYPWGTTTITCDNSLPLTASAGSISFTAVKS